jgi:hypothetical protein
MSAHDSQPKSDTTQKAASRNPPGGPIVLNSRMLRMIHLLVHGNERDPSHTPYGIYDAAHAVGYRRTAARALAMSPVFYEAYQRELDGRGNAGIVPTLEEIRHELELRRRKKAHLPPPATIAATAHPAPLVPGFVIRLRPKEAAKADE